MSESRREATIRRFHERMLVAPDVGAVREAMTDDAVMDFPQSGERFQGPERIARAFMEYPSRDGLEDDGKGFRVTGSPDRMAITPMFTVVRVGGQDDELVARRRLRYPDGSLWWVIEYLTFRGDKVCRAEIYFAPDFEAPAWRAPFSDRISR